MKKLNRKGFTLIELLAVIVILAIIIVVTVPTIINTIADARKNSLWNLAGSVANSYGTIVAQDLLASEPVIPEGSEATTTWTCISTDLAKVLDLSGEDVNINSNTVPVSGDRIHVESNNFDTNTCSAIRIKDNGAAEVLLVAKKDGRFSISGKVVFAVSSNTEANTKNITTPS